MGAAPLEAPTGAVEPRLPQVLVVDDEPHVVDAMRRTLHQDFELIGVGDGPSALRLIAAQEVAVALVDLSLPGMHGLSLLERLREAAPNTVRIVHSGQMSFPHALATINRGSVFRFLTKPCRPELLHQALTDAVRQHALITADAELMERRVRELSSQLLRAERLASLGTMAAAVGHELGNLAGAYAGVFDMVLTRTERGQPLGEDEIGCLSMVRDHLTTHAQNLRQLGLPRSEGPAEVDVASVCGETVNMLSQVGLLHGCQVSVSLPPSPAMVLIDRTRLEQVLVNLIKNAVDAMEELEGGRRLQVQVSCDTETTAVRLGVRDNGTGIAASDLEKLFEPYFTTKAADKGTGLGLPVVKQIVEAQGGQIRCESQVGVGTLFEIAFPLAG